MPAAKLEAPSLSYAASRSRLHAQGGANAMSTTHHNPRPTARQSGGLSRPLKTALLMARLIGGFYLLREHWVDSRKE